MAKSKNTNSVNELIKGLLKKGANNEVRQKVSKPEDRDQEKVNEKIFIFSIPDELQ